jgi:hypothetical protein
VKKKQKERKEVPRGEPKKKKQLKELRLLWKTKENCS